MRQEDRDNEAANPDREQATPAEMPARSIGSILTRVAQVAGIAVIPAGYIFPLAFSSYMGSAAMAQAGTLTRLPACVRSILAVHAGAQAVNATNFVGYTLGGYAAGVAVISSASGVVGVAAEELVSRVGAEGVMRLLRPRRSEEEVARHLAESTVGRALVEGVAEASAIICRNNS